jgi:voltage-gated potassium channel Kch
VETLAALLGFVLLLVVLWDTFETIVLPRSVTRSFRLTRLFYRVTWTLWSAAAGRLRPGGRRDALLGYFGPLSLILLLGFWAVCLIAGFALLQWGLGIALNTTDADTGFGTYLYMSGVTLFTLGFGDVTPRAPLGRSITVAEAGVGIGFLALVIGYLPVLYQAFSRREVGISLLDARAGSPPTAVELLRRHGQAGQMAAMIPLLQEWERWSAELLESHLSYPVLMYYRSQHDRESWLAALTAILDTCALVRGGLAGEHAWQSPLRWQAKMTFAMARHAVVDLALVMGRPPASPKADRLPPEISARLRAILIAAGLPWREEEEGDREREELRDQYEPYVYALAQALRVELPPFIAQAETADNWQTSAWETERHF